jgi:ketol-acid reductoisomerase
MEDAVESMEEAGLDVRVAVRHGSQTLERCAQNRRDLLLLANDIKQNIDEVGVVENLLGDLRP